MVSEFCGLVPIGVFGFFFFFFFMFLCPFVYFLYA